MSSPFAAAYRTVTVGIVLQVTLIAFESLAVSTAMPVVASDLGGLRQYGLAFSLFITATVFGVVAAGAWNDARGPSAPARVGFVLFAGGLIICGLAPSMPVLLLGRLVAGAGGGLLGVSLYVVIAQVYPSELQPRVFALISAAWMLPGVVGPGVAGWVAQSIDWRLVFLAVPPLTLVAALALIPRLRRMGPSGGTRTPVSGLRLVRGAVAACGVGLFQFGLAEQGIVLVVAGAVMAVSTLPWLLPAGTFLLRRGLPTVVALRGLFGGAFYGADVFVPLMLVSERGVSPAVAGFTLTGAVVGWSTGSWLQGRQLSRVPRHLLLTLGGLLLAAGLLAMTLTPWQFTPVWVVIPIWAVAGLGMGIGMSTTSVLMLQLSDPGEEGRNAAGLNLGETVGQALGVGCTGAVFAALHSPQGSDADVFTGMWLVLGLAALFAGAVAHRARRPRSRPGGVAAEEHGGAGGEERGPADQHRHVPGREPLVGEGAASDRAHGVRGQPGGQAHQG